MKVVVFLGAPGSGKGTIANALVADDATLHHVSSGDLLREAAKLQTVDGRKAEKYMQQGTLVPDTLIAHMIADYMLNLPGTHTILLDGFPRTVGQVGMLDEIVQLCKTELVAAVVLEVPDNVIVTRIAGRRGCSQCSASYHVTNIPPKVAGVCDKCGAPLVIRKDDEPETVKSRLAAFYTQTMPVVDLYEQRGLLYRVDGSGKIPGIVKRTRQAWA